MIDLNNPDDLLSKKELALRNKLLFLNEDLGEDTVVELTEVFVESTDDILKKLDAAVLKNDFIEIRNLVHSMRGNSGTFGFESLVASCKDIEVNISENKLENILSSIKDIIAEVKEDVFLLKKMINQ
jgi:HPt (histidine-containing phosphotransfer) domain-containing protein